MIAWDDLGIQVKPHFATAYPGSMWFTEYRDKNYQARLQDVMKARKLMDRKRERDEIKDLAQELAQEILIIDTLSLIHI